MACFTARSAPLNATGNWSQNRGFCPFRDQLRP